MPDRLPVQGHFVFVAGLEAGGAAHLELDIAAATVERLVVIRIGEGQTCLLYTSDAADE